MSALAITGMSAAAVAVYRVIRPVRRGGEAMGDQTVILRLPVQTVAVDRSSLAGVDESVRLRLRQVTRVEPTRPVEVEDYYEPERWDGMS